MFRLTVLLFLFASGTTGLATPVISEFLASNKHVLADEDGDYSDWIEIHNPDAAPVDMNGWYLTDKVTDLRKWQFPAVTIPAGGYLVVFASNKDRRVAGHELHTNFALSADGEYLGLIAPDGVTKVSEFAPEFPEQFEDVSYGVSSSLQTVSLAGLGSSVRALVPTNNALGTTWRARTFDDSGWTTGTQAVGFFNHAGKTSNPDLSSTLGLNVDAEMGGQARGCYVRVPLEIPDPSQVQKLTLRIKYDDGFAAFLNGVTVATGNCPAVSSLAYNSFALGVYYPNSFEEFDLTPYLPQLVAGTNILALHGLNESTSSSDAYLLAEVEMVAESDVEPVTGYFPVPTPGTENGGPESVQLPQTVAFSRPSGTFTSTFSLTMTGASSGQQIRYVIADPSSLGAALAAPTMSSTLYSGPISISSSKLIRAAVFDPATGQKGEVRTMQYLLLETGASKNTSNFTSTLPIAVADDHGDGQPVDSGTGTYTTSMFYLFEPVNGTASLNSTPTVAARSGIRVRGSSSATFPKKSYALETWSELDDDTDVSLLGLADDSDWVLNGPWYYDDAYIRNAVAYELSREVGRWAPRTRFVEMFANFGGGKLDTDDYAGLYVLTEKIKSSSDRLDITGIDPGDVSGDALTGGYIFKIDRADPDEVSWTTANDVPIPASSGDQRLVIVEPDPDKDNSEQIDYLQGYVQQFDTTLFNERSAGFTTRDYRRYIDVTSFVDHHILNSLMNNVDALRLSAFMHKDRNERIQAGPVWDFDRSAGSDDGRDASATSWGDQSYFFTYGWWGPLFQDPEFVQDWVDRWWELRSGPLTAANIGAIVDGLGNEIGNTVGARDAAKWPDNAPDSGDVYLDEVAKLKSWLTARATWLDTRAPKPPTASLDSGVVSAGTTVTLSGSGGTIRYETDGTDPRPYGGGTTSDAASGTGPITINQTTVLRARRLGTFAPFPSATSIRWSAPLLRVYLVNEAFAAAGDIAVSEIHFAPADPTPAERAALIEPVAGHFEFVELRNVGTRTVNTFEMQFADGHPFKALKLAPLTLAPGEIALVVRNRAAFEARYGTALSSRIVGEWGEGSLSNDGEEIRLLARDGSLVQSLTYETDDIPNGASLNLVDGKWISDAPSPGTDGPTFAQWTAYHFPAGGAISEPDADPDTDTADNEHEYARGTNPQAADPLTGFDPVFTLTSDPDGSHFHLTYRRPLNRPGAHYQVEKTTDFVNWTPVADSPVSTANGMETREATGPAGEPDAPSSLFLRVRADVDP